MKQHIRERVWDDLEASGEARFPFPPHGRIPNFAGADEAAERLAATPEWRDADVLKANPDAPQLPVRRRALRAGKTVYMAVPRLREAECFLELDPGRVDDTDAAATVSGMDEHGRPVGPADVEPVDLVVAGSVAVDERGGRVGKGEGYSDLEYAVLREFDRLDGDTTVATSVHELQLFDGDGTLDAGSGEGFPEPAPHDVPIDIVVTPERVLRTGTDRTPPDGVDWDLLDEERLEEIPVLRRLRER